MNICLIIPPSSFLLDERVFISLGILRVAAVLEKEGHEVEVLDLSGVKDFIALRQYLESSSIGVFGITATTPQMPAVKKIVNNISMYGKDKIILGGPHVTMTHAARHKYRAKQAWQDLLDMADVLVAGDGEWAMLEAIKHDAPKVINSDSPLSDTFLSKDDLDRLPFPARHLVAMDSYRYAIDGEKATSLICQLGCPFGCTFCGGRLSPSFRRVRLRSTENVMAEIDHLYRTYGYKGFMFYDDELNVNPKFVAFMQALVTWQEVHGVDLKLRGFVKAELFTDEQAAWMHRAGFRWLLTGFESGSERILTNINKRATVSDNTRCVETARRHGLKVKALMSIGHAGESAWTVNDTRQWLLDVAPDELDVTVITPYPGSPYYDESIAVDDYWAYTAPKTGDKLYSKQVNYLEEADYYKGVPGEYVSHVWTDHLTAKELVDCRDELEREVKAQLGIPLLTSSAARSLEHSMGQSLPPSILKRQVQEVS